ncbi:uncharacterized protein LOC115956906 [Quercus lobata]|uniref:uncharacterized protein LOC115956906 n=1 Tax=Quercus lobata TaxID=97700 RepID=UPI00124420ED|nr:uncharacterized protein LOC115956906 [Quercus lobata]
MGDLKTSQKRNPTLTYLPHFQFHASISLTPHASITPSLTHTSLHQSTSATGLHTPASTRRPPRLLHIPHRGTAHTYSLSRLTASTPHESASTCRPSHVVLPTQLDLFILTAVWLATCARCSIEDGQDIIGEMAAILCSAKMLARLLLLLAGAGSRRSALAAIASLLASTSSVTALGCSTSSSMTASGSATSESASFRMILLGRCWLMLRQEF